MLTVSNGARPVPCRSPRLPSSRPPADLQHSIDRRRRAIGTAGARARQRHRAIAGGDHRRQEGAGQTLLAGRRRRQHHAGIAGRASRTEGPVQRHRAGCRPAIGIDRGKAGRAQIARHAGDAEAAKRLAHRRRAGAGRIARGAQARERLSSIAALKAPAPVRAPGIQVIKLPHGARTRRALHGRRRRQFAGADAAARAGGIGRDIGRHRALVEAVGLVETDLRPGSRPAARSWFRAPAASGWPASSRNSAASPASSRSRVLRGRQPRAPEPAETGKPVEAKASPGATIRCQGSAP